MEEYSYGRKSSVLSVPSLSSSVGCSKNPTRRYRRNPIRIIGTLIRRPVILVLVEKLRSTRSASTGMSNAMMNFVTWVSVPTVWICFGVNTGKGMWFCLLKEECNCERVAVSINRNCDKVVLWHRSPLRRWELIEAELFCRAFAARGSLVFVYDVFMLPIHRVRGVMDDVFLFFQYFCSTSSATRPARRHQHHRSPTYESSTLYMSASSSFCVQYMETVASRKASRKASVPPLLLRGENKCQVRPTIVRRFCLLILWYPWWLEPM